MSAPDSASASSSSTHRSRSISSKKQPAGAEFLTTCLPRPRTRLLGRSATGTAVPWGTRTTTEARARPNARFPSPTWRMKKVCRALLSLRKRTPSGLSLLRLNHLQFLQLRVAHEPFLTSFSVKNPPLLPSLRAFLLCQRLAAQSQSSDEDDDGDSPRHGPSYA